MTVQRPRLTTLASLVTTLLLVAGLIVAAPAGAGTAGHEQRFVQLINQTRTGAGLPPLVVHPELQGQARSWAASMAGTGQLAHAPDISVGISAPWTVLGENVGVHGIEDVHQLHQAFVDSPSHYANIVDARYGYVGVGVVVTEDGELWTTHRFMATADAPTPPTSTPPTSGAPTTTPPATTPSTTTPTTTSPTTPTTTAVPATAPPATVPTTTAAQPIDDADPEEQAPAPTGGGADNLDRGADIEPVRAGPDHDDIAAVEQMLVDLIDAGI